MTSRRLVASVCVALAVAAAACGGGEETAAPVAAREASAITLPEQVLGLQVDTEELELRALQNTYFDSLGLFAFRTEEELLRATLQVGRFNEHGRPGDGDFRRRIISNLGSTEPEELRVGEQLVYLTTGNQQNIFAWFEGDGFFVLSIRNDYLFPRTLLRKLLEMELMS